MPRAKKLIPVSEDIIDELMKIAKRSGLSVTELVDIILRNTVKVLHSRDDIDGFLIESLVRSDLARMGGVTIPLNVLSLGLSKLNDDERENALKTLESFASLVVRMAIARGINGLNLVKLLLRAWLSQFNIEVLDREDYYQILVSGFQLADDTTIQLVISIINGILKEVKAKDISFEHSPGLIITKFKL